MLSDDQIKGIIASAADDIENRWGTIVKERRVTRDELESAAGLGVATALTEPNPDHVHAWNRARYYCLRELRAAKQRSTRIDYVGGTNELAAISDEQARREPAPNPPDDLIEQEEQNALEWWNERIAAEVEALSNPDRDVIQLSYGISRNRWRAMHIVAAHINVEPHTAYRIRERACQTLHDSLARDATAMARIDAARAAIRRSRAPGRVTSHARRGARWQ